MSQDREGTVCAYPWQQMNIDLTGEVFPCCFWGNYGNTGKPLGNTNEQTLDEIWNGEAYRELRRRNASGDMKGFPCHECMAWKWGGGTYPKFSWPVSFAPERGHCYLAPIPERFLEAIEGATEPVLFFEDGEPLPTPDALHDDIREQGAGRYSVWGTQLYFSTSDNSDPVTNGRAYELRCGEHAVRIQSLVRDSTSGENLLTAYDEYRRGVEEMQAKPSWITFIATADCNIDCPACSQNTVRITKVQHRERTEPDVLALVPYLYQFTYYGGEPYLMKRFRAFVDGFRTEDNPNLSFGFTTNGTALDAAELAKLDKFPRVNAAISVDSFVPETFARIRAGARYETVVENVLRAFSTYDAPDRVFAVGMIVVKSNVLELPTNVRFAMEHGVGLNLSPVMAYPVDEQLNVFRDYQGQTAGWREAIEQALEVVARAKTDGAVAVRRVDPEGHLRALLDVLDEQGRRYGDVFPLRVVVTDPYGSLPKMRNPGVIVWRDDADLPLSYAPFEGEGTSTLMLPRADLAGDKNIFWSVVHDLKEPMGQIDRDRFRDRSMRPVSESGWREMPTELHLELPPFEPVPRDRNILVANKGLPRPDGLEVRDPQDMFGNYQERMAAESRAGHGLVGDGTPEEIIARRATALRESRYRAFESLAT